MFFHAQNRPQRAFPPNRHNSTPSHLKRNVGQIRGVSERARTIHRTIHTRKYSNQTKKPKKPKKQEKIIDNSQTMLYNIIINNEKNDLGRKKMTKVKANIKTVAKELAESIGSDNMELYLTADGETGFRQIGSFGPNESEVVYKVSLDKVYWRDGFENIGLDIDKELSEEELETVIDYIEQSELGYATDCRNGEELEWDEN